MTKLEKLQYHLGATHTAKKRVENLKNHAATSLLSCTDMIRIYNKIDHEYMRLLEAVNNEIRKERNKAAYVPTNKRVKQT